MSSPPQPAVDPAERAASELNQFFGQLDVPCHVEHTEARGKYVVADGDIAAGTVLVEELPVVSWPSADLLSSKVPFCFHCLCLKTHRVPRSQLTQLRAGAEADTPHAETSSPDASSWSVCEHCKSWFCSDDCRRQALRVHRLLCASLPALRQGLSDTPATAELAGDGRSGQADGSAGGITREALARCVAWLLTRVASAIERQSLTYDFLQADFAAQNSEDATALQSSSAVVSQLFAQVTAPFNRLIAPPDATVFANVEKEAWFAATREAVASRGIALLRLAAGRTDGDDSHAQSAVAEDWASVIVEAAVRDDTLTTILGQLNLNAHAVNDYVLPCDDDVAHKAEAGKANGNLPFAWMMKGAAVYTLLSAFNHSCCPNVTVSCVDGTHEISLSVTEAVKKGEELCITYIPLHPDSSRSERQALLKHYLFQCQCPLCKREA